MKPPSLTFVCPVCSRPLKGVDSGRLRCSADRQELVRAAGIWRFLTPERTAEAERFLADYHRLRRDEGWHSDESEYYRALPFRDTTGRHEQVWRIRAASYELLHRRVLAGPRQARPRPAGGLRIADLGAGNCWLSWRLSEAGHSVAAVDLSVDPADGLGAASAYGETAEFVRVQASFDEVPFAAGGLDLVVFDGSFHYSGDYRRTLGEAVRLVGAGGRVVIMDTPVYRRAASGERMVRERRRAWRERYGAGFGAAPAEGFLTRRRLRELGAALGIRWRFHPLPLGWRWHLGPLFAVLRGRREPARFPLIVGRPVTQDRGGPTAVRWRRPGAINVP